MSKTANPSDDRTITINESLAIELIPNNNEDAPPALCLYTQDHPEQSIVILLSEIHLLRDALAEAGTRLSKMRVIAKYNKDTRPKPDTGCGESS